MRNKRGTFSMEQLVSTKETESTTPVMKAIQKHTAGFGAKLVDVPVPTPGPGEVLIQVKATSICGTDVHIYEWDEWSQSRVKPPYVFGHEFSGRSLRSAKGRNGSKSDRRCLLKHISSVINVSNVCAVSTTSVKTQKSSGWTRKDVSQNMSSCLKRIYG